jgi:hypothetical protein
MKIEKSIPVHGRHLQVVNPTMGTPCPRPLLTVRTLDRVLVYTVNSRGHVVPLESPTRAYPSIPMTGEPSGLSVPLSSHEIDGVRKEK